MRSLLWILVPLLLLAGCSGTPGDSTVEAESQAITVTTPDATVEDHQRGLASADMSPEVKKVLGGAGR